jgi:hypothetical protein
MICTSRGRVATEEGSEYASSSEEGPDLRVHIHKTLCTIHSICKEKLYCIFHDRPPDSRLTCGHHEASTGTRDWLRRIAVKEQAEKVVACRIRHGVVIV